MRETNSGVKRLVKSRSTGLLATSFGYTRINSIISHALIPSYLPTQNTNHTHTHMLLITNVGLLDLSESKSTISFIHLLFVGQTVRSLTLT